MHKPPITYCKPAIINLEVLCEQYRKNPDFIESEQTPNDYNPYRVRDLQLYNPIYNKFFEMNATNYNTNIVLNNEIKYAILTMYNIENLIFGEVTTYYKNY